jgi:hypothetical protein
MTKVFVGGSRAITRLDAEVKSRLDRIVAKRLAVVIGDASGADKAVQRFLAERQFEKVEVFSTDESPRNNLGSWPVRVVRPGHSRKDFDYYATKDRAMAAEATVGLMLWDGQSRGTLMNVVRLVGHAKPAVVYVQPGKRFAEVRSQSELSILIGQLGRQTAIRLRADAAAEGLDSGLAAQAALGF